MSPTQGGRVRIGELSRRTGVGVDALRAWERRYGVLQPERSSGGFRLYSEADEQRVRAMTRMMERGVPTAEAARTAIDGGPGGAASPLQATDGDVAEGLCAALVALDEERAADIFDRAVAALSTDALVRDVVLPALRELGARWSRGEIGVGEEHFASNFIRGRLLGLARGWSTGGSPPIVLACPPGEQHDLGLIGFGLVLRARGWRVAYLGQDTPVDTVADMARRLGGAPVVLAAVDPQRMRAISTEVRDLTLGGVRVFMGGAGADAQLAAQVSAGHLGEDPVSGASVISSTV